MWRQDRTTRRIDTWPIRDAGDPAAPEATGGRDDVLPIGEAVRTWALEALAAAYGRDTYRLLTDLADLLEASIAYVDRPTVAAHLEGPLSDGEWSAVAAQFTAMAFDEHVGDAGTVRTDWIEDTLRRASIPGRSLRATDRRGLEQAARRAARLQGRVPRECTHPQARHRHGTRAAYVKDRCRCTDCTAANTAASRSVTREWIYGRWQPYVDARPVREHIAALRAGGIGVERIAHLAGLSVSHIRQLAQHGHSNSPLTQRVRPSTATRVLCIAINHANRAPRSRVDATGTRRRLQALMAIGWAPELLAVELDRRPNSLLRSMTGLSVTPAPPRTSRASTSNCGTPGRHWRPTSNVPLPTPTPSRLTPSRKAGCRRWPGTTSTPTPPRRR